MKISKPIFYTKNFNQEINTPVDVILSPEFYWIKKIDIQIKSIYQAKKIAKNIFELDGEYIYDAIKLDNKFFAIAIKKDLKLNIKNRYISSIRIAQVEFYNYDCIKAEEIELKKVNDILFVFPSKDKCKNDINKVLSEIKLSNYKININKTNIDKSIFISVIFISLFFIFGTISYKQEYNKLLQKETSLSKYNLPLTFFQLDAIYNDLVSIDKTQTKIRKDLEFISRVPLKKGEYFIKLSYNNGYEVKIKTSKNLDFYFKRKFKINSTYKNQIYTAKMSNE